LPAYIIAEVDVHDPVPYEEYRKLIGPTLAKYGGKFIVRGGKIDVLEGGWSPKRLVVLEFDSAARAREWYDSEEYRIPKQIRMKASKGNLVLVDGI
jgi:uncharacterized protein (DUF1330 family)